MKKIFRAFLSICLTLSCVFLLSACGDKLMDDNGDLTSPSILTPSESPVQQLGPTDISFDGAITKDTQDLGSLLYVTSPNSKLVFSFSDYVKVNENSTWSVSFDISGNIPVTSKTVSLDVGDNLYYILVTSSNGNSKQYIVMIHRNAMYTVNYVTGTATTIDSITIEEGDYIKKPNIVLEKSMFKFNGWNYDFTKPVTDNITITAQWLRVEQGSYPGTDAKVTIYFYVLKGNNLRDFSYAGEVFVEQYTIVEEVLPLANIKNRFNDNSKIGSINDIILYLKSKYEFEQYLTEIDFEFLHYYLDAHSLSNSGYNPGRNEEYASIYSDDGDTQLTGEYYDLYFVFQMIEE